MRRNFERVEHASPQTRDIPEVAGHENERMDFRRRREQAVDRRDEAERAYPPPFHRDTNVNGQDAFFPDRERNSSKNLGFPMTSPPRWRRVGFYATVSFNQLRDATIMQNAEKISVTMTPDMLRTLRESVEAGEYASTSEALRDAVRLWQRQRVEDAERLTAIRARVKRSLDDPRPDLSEEEVVARLARLHEETAKAQDDAAA